MISLDYPLAGRIYGLSLVLGVAVVTLSLYLGVRQIQLFERDADLVYQQATLTSLELDSLNQELQSLDEAVRQSLHERADGAGEQETHRFSKEEIAHIMIDVGRLKNQIQTKSSQLVQVSEAKNVLLRGMAITFFSVLFAFPAGIVLIVLGILGMRFRIKVFEDRRVQPRADE